jgi:hypothetical protein
VVGKTGEVSTGKGRSNRPVYPQHAPLGSSGRDVCAPLAMNKIVSFEWPSPSSA